MSEKMALPLDVTDLSVSVPGRRLVDSLGFNASPGEIIAVLGRNGSGKSLTLHTLAGLRAPDSGAVLLQGMNIAQHKRQAAARLLALLPQVIDDIFPATVLDTALIGRHPHIAPFSWESTDDLEAARQALATMGLGAMHDRDILTLSGGERRRLAPGLFTRRADQPPRPPAPARNAGGIPQGRQQWRRRHGQPARCQSGGPVRRPLPAAVRGWPVAAR
jgi:iron complex transport system ATP-binding protein